MLTNTKQKVFNIYSCSTRLLHGISNILLSVNQSAHSEQTYEMTDHEIHQKDNNKTNDKVEYKQNSEQNDTSVFALVN